MNALTIPHLFQEELYSFRSPLVVVLPREWSTYSPDDQALLKKILTSVKIDINAVLLIAMPSLGLSALRVYMPVRVLVFGSELAADLPMYQESAAYGFTVIRADDLNVLDDQKKKNLWSALRQMFGV